MITISRGKLRSQKVRRTNIRSVQTIGKASISRARVSELNEASGRDKVCAIFRLRVRPSRRRERSKVVEARWNRGVGVRRQSKALGDCYRAGFPPSQLSRINWKSSISPSFRGAAFRGIAAAWLSLWFKVAIDQRLLPRGSPRKPETWPHAAFRSPSASSRSAAFFATRKKVGRNQ